MAHAFIKCPSMPSNQQCAKIGYPSRREALTALKRHSPPSPTVRHGNGKMVCFRCRVCNLFHLGHE